MKTSMVGLLIRWCYAAFIALYGRFPPRFRDNCEGRIVIFKPDGIGDFILAIGTIRFLAGWAKRTHGFETEIIVADFCEQIAKREFPDCIVTAISFAEDGFRGGAIPALRKAHKVLRRNEKAILVSLRHHPTRVQDLLLRWIAPGRSYALKDSPFLPPQARRRFRATSCAPYPPASMDGPRELVANAAIASLVSGESIVPRDIPPRLQSYRTADHGALVIFPFASHGIRQYPLPLLATVIRELASVPFTSIQICGPPRSIGLLQDFQRQIGKTQISCSVSSTSTIDDAAELIATSRAVLGMESGPAHIATALGKPGVFILGGGHHGFFAPWGDPDRQIWIDHPLPCYMCNWQCRFTEPKCITEIQPALIIAAMRRALPINAGGLG